MVYNLSSTHWSAVINAQDLNNPEAYQALAKLYEKYWLPLYVYVRRKGYNVEDSQDLVQGFFTKLIEKEYLKKVSKEKGKFRTFLLMAMNNYIMNEWNKSMAQKRGGGSVPLPLDFETAEKIYSLEPATDISPDKIYERLWVTSLLNRVMDELGNEFSQKDKKDLFRYIKSYLIYDDPNDSYADIACKLQISEGIVKTSIHRARKRFGDLLKIEISHTLADTKDVEEEIRYLFSVFS